MHLDAKLHLTLLSLYRRKNPKAFWWYANEASKKSYAVVYRCNLCDKEFYSVPIIEEHGYSHLKESNLLPFI